MNTETTKLLKEVQFLRKAIDKNGILPILDNIQFDDKGMHTSNLSTNISIAREHSLRCSVNATKLYKILAAVRHIDMVELTQGGTEANPLLKIKAGKMNFTLAGAAFGDFPVAPHQDGQYKWSEFVKGIDSDLIASSVQFAGTDELRPVMAGVYVGEEIVATDAHVLVRRKNPCNTNGRSIIIPRKPASILAKCGEIDMYVNAEDDLDWVGNVLVTKCELPGGITLSWRNIDGRYPNYAAVWPEENPKSFIVNKSKLYRQVNAALNVANSYTHQIEFEFEKDVLRLRAEDRDFDNGFQGEVEAEATGDAERFRIGFNGKFLKKVIGCIKDDTVTISMSESNRAGIWSDTFLIMPVMLND